MVVPEEDHTLLNGNWRVHHHLGPPLNQAHSPGKFFPKPRRRTVALQAPADQCLAPSQQTLESTPPTVQTASTRSPPSRSFHCVQLHEPPHPLDHSLHGEASVQPSDNPTHPLLMEQKVIGAEPPTCLLALLHGGFYHSLLAEQRLQGRFYGS